MPISIDDVEPLSSDNWSQLDDKTKKSLLDQAESATDHVYGGRVARLNQIESDREFFVKNLAAHYWTLAEGGEPTSESATGGSVSYNTVTGDTMSNLTETRYGRICRDYIRNQQSVGIVRTRR